MTAPEFQFVDRQGPVPLPVGQQQGWTAPAATRGAPRPADNQAGTAATHGMASPFPSISQEDHAQADRTAGATIPRSPSSTGGGVSFHHPAPRPFDVNVDKDGHQVRERAVNCRLCGRAKTWNHDARCDGCKRQRCYEQGPVLDSTCLLPLGHDDPHVWTDEVAR